MNEKKPPLFVMGAQRSGTTMLRLMLDTHSQIAIPFETDFIIPYYIKFGSCNDLCTPDKIRWLVNEVLVNPFVRRGEMACMTTDQVLEHITEQNYAGVVDAVFRTWASTRNKTRWGDKNPGVPGIHVLNRLFPDATFLHVIRDGRDVAASRMRTWRQPSVLAAAHHWCWNVEFVRKVGRILGARYKEIRFETLATVPEESLREVCDWLGEQFEPAMLEYYRTATQRLPTYSAERHHQSSVRPPDPTKVGMWRHVMSRGDRAVFQAVAKPLLCELGYEVEDDRRLSFRVLRKVSEVKHVIRGLTVFESPCVDSWS
jgi:hypothetical protein